MADDDDFELIRRFNAAGRDEDDSCLDDILTPDFVAHSGGEDVRGVEGWRAFIAETAAQYGPTNAGIDELIRGGNLIAERWWVSANPDGTAETRAHGVTMHRIENGRIAENWAVMQMDTPGAPE